jgi:uncharacterized protein YkwD
MKRIKTALLATLASCSLCISVSQISPAYAAPGFAPHTAPSRDYVVKAGDTLLAIAVKYGVSMAAIQIANDLSDPAMIRAGQSLKIPSEKVHPNESPFWSAYEVKAGDTLGAISNALGVNLNDLLKVNKLGDASMLQIGQLLIVPVNGNGATPAQQPQTVAPKQPAAQPPQQTIELIPLDQPVQGAPQPTPVPQAQPPAVQILPQAASADVEAIRQNLLAYYNQARAANGLPALTYSALLQGVAQAHADECAARNQGSHVGLDGSRPSQRITRAGYPGRVTGENWAWARSAEQAFDMWYTQEIASNGPHLQNILSARYSEVGFGIAANRGGYYLIANFGGQ